MKPISLDNKKMKRKTEEDTSSNKKLKTKTPSEQFEELINQKETEFGKKFFPLETVSEEEELTLDILNSLSCIYLEESTLKEIDSLNDQLFKKMGVDEQDSFITTNTSTSYVFFDFFDAVIGEKKFKKVSEEFTKVFAITHLFKTYEYWFRDTDVPDEVERILNELGRRWLKLLGENESDCGYAGEHASQYLVDWLNDLKAAVEESLPDLELEDWVESEGEHDEPEEKGEYDEEEDDGEEEEEE
jgi:hypothetical protein